ncbi:MAG: GatB/YqeY domain-containing protein, partial [Patescibacteria group bacterium]
AYMPPQMTEEEIKNLAKKAIEQAGLPAGKAGAKSQKEMGKLMAILMPWVKGKADGSLVSKIVRELL